jgi:hypothetical protein
VFSRHWAQKQARNAVLILTLANILAFIDRQIPAMLVGPIKQDFGLAELYATSGLKLKQS